jgi:hypothetical protein
LSALLPKALKSKKMEMTTTAMGSKDMAIILTPSWILETKPKMAFFTRMNHEALQGIGNFLDSRSRSNSPKKYAAFSAFQ